MPLPYKKAFLSGFGGYPKSEALVARPERYHQLFSLQTPYIARGLGQSFGDAALNSEGSVILTERLNRCISFDEKTGTLKAEAGLLLKEVIKIFLRRGWFLPVTGHTQNATLGGCLAADIYGKNHSTEGSFSQHVKEIDLILPDGTSRICSPNAYPELFWATAGGLGLTGFIGQITLKLKKVESAYLIAKHKASDTINETIDLLEQETEEPYAFAWIDGLARGKAYGRGIVKSAHHATKGELPDSLVDPFCIKHAISWTFPFNLPFSPSFVNQWLGIALNDLQYKKQSKKTFPFIIDYERFFYPFDNVDKWYRFYGKKGAVHYECVFPNDRAKEGVNTILTQIKKSGRNIYRVTLKKLGEQGFGMLSFPIKGYNLSFDIPIDNLDFFHFLTLLDNLVVEYQGRVNLTSRIGCKPEIVSKMYPNLNVWQAIKLGADPHQKISSDLYRRLFKN